jgi:adenylylsulfate kinase
MATEGQDIMERAGWRSVSAGAKEPEMVIDRAGREPRVPCVGFTVWLTGLPCSGKSTIANALAAHLRERALNVEVLDGDVVRQNLSKGLGFSRSDRDTNILRIGFVAHLLSRNGVIVIVAAVSPYAAARDQVRKQIGRFVEVHVDCPLGECERRDVKGMYRQARVGTLSAFTGLDDPYEPPIRPELKLPTREENVESSLSKLLGKLIELGYLSD